MRVTSLTGMTRLTRDNQGDQGNQGEVEDTLTGCAIFVRDYFKWSVFGSMTKLMGSSKTHGVTSHVGI